MKMAYRLLLVTMMCTVTACGPGWFSAGCDSAKQTMENDPQRNATNTPSTEQGASGNTATVDEEDAAPKERPVPKVPGVDTRDLDADEVDVLIAVLAAFADPCAKAANLGAALALTQPCALADVLAAEAVHQLRYGYSKKQVLDALDLALKRRQTQHQFRLKGRPFVGRADAPIVVVEFTDFECPFCKRVSRKVLAIAENHKDVKVVFKQYPLRQHEMAMPAAVAALCAHRQGKFVPAKKKLFEAQEELSGTRIATILKSLGIKRRKLDADRAWAEAMIAEDKVDAEAAGLDGTPSYYVNGYVVNYSSLEERIATVRQALVELEESPAP